MAKTEKGHGNESNVINGCCLMRGWVKMVGQFPEGLDHQAAPKPWSNKDIRE